MGEIPEDVLQIGIRIAEDIPSRVCSKNRAFAARVIARAILAERKRSAGVVHRVAKDFYGNTDQMYAAALIVSAIEAGQ